MAVRAEDLENRGLVAVIGPVELPVKPRNVVSFEVAESVVRSMRNEDRSVVRNELGHRDFSEAARKTRRRLADAIYEDAPLKRRVDGRPYTADQEQVVVQHLDLIVEAMLRMQLIPQTGDIDFGPYSPTSSQNHSVHLRNNFLESRLERYHQSTDKNSQVTI